MLKTLWRWLWPQDATKTQPSSPQLELDFVSRAEFESEIQKLNQRIEWDLSEWYDKFSTLHARAAKRVQRQQNGNGVEQVEQQPQQQGPSSILHVKRKPWSV